MLALQRESENPLVRLKYYLISYFSDCLCCVNLFKKFWFSIFFFHLSCNGVIMRLNFRVGCRNLLPWQPIACQDSILRSQCDASSTLLFFSQSLKSISAEFEISFSLSTRVKNLGEFSVEVLDEKKKIFSCSLIYLLNSSECSPQGGNHSL